MNTVQNRNQLYTIKEVCELLKLSRRTIYKMINRGDLNAINTGILKKSYRITQTEIQRWIDSKTYLANPNVEYVKLDSRLVF